jgi:hypothetical protein
MPLDLSDLKAKTRAVSVQYEGETINITYRPQAVNPEYQSMVGKTIKGNVENQSEAWERMLAVMADWDIVDGGKPLPINRETLGMLPTNLLGAIFDAIITDALPNLKSGGTSAAGLGRRAR